MGNSSSNEYNVERHIFHMGKSNGFTFEMSDDGEIYNEDGVVYNIAQQLNLISCIINDDNIHQWMRGMSKEKRNLIWTWRTGRCNNADFLFADVTHFIPLRKLQLFGHSLDVVPPCFSALTNLTFLDLSDNRLATFPVSVTTFTALQRLELHENRLVTIPSEISHLKLLTFFSLWSNRLTSLPVELYQLTQLEALHLNNNRLTRLDAACANLRKIHNFTVRENCFRYPKVYEQGFSAILKYFRISTVLLILKTYTNQLFPFNFPLELIYVLCDLMILLNYS
jgi:Leucine-rich repeat (LRR) protein